MCVSKHGLYPVKAFGQVAERGLNTCELGQYQLAHSPTHIHPIRQQIRCANAKVEFPSREFVSSVGDFPKDQVVVDLQSVFLQLSSRGLSLGMAPNYRAIAVCSDHVMDGPSGFSSFHFSSSLGIGTSRRCFAEEGRGNSRHCGQSLFCLSEF
jgi:hypothetical protein